jgi:hypothetical protein
VRNARAPTSGPSTVPMPPISGTSSAATEISTP